MVVVRDCFLVAQLTSPFFVQSAGVGGLLTKGSQLEREALERLARSPKVHGLLHQYISHRLLDVEVDSREMNSL